VTKTLLFLGEGSNAVIGTPQTDWAWGKKVVRTTKPPAR